MPDGPRVALCVPRYGAGIVGGAETLARLMAQNLVAHGTHLEVLTTCAVDHFTWTDAHPEGATVEDGVTVRRFAVSRDRDADRFWQCHGGIATDAPMSYADELEWMANSVWSPGLQNALEDDTRYDWVVAIPYLFGTTFWAAAGRTNRTALIPCVHDESHAWTRVVRSALAAVGGCMLNSIGEGQLLHRLAPTARTQLVGVGYEEEPVPTTVEVQAFCAARGIEPGYLLYAGRRESAKGLPLLFESYAQLRRDMPHAPPLALMGSGELPVPDDIAPHVIELGYVPTPDRAAAYASASVLAHPSELESLGMVMLEAWLAGTPAVVNSRSPVLLQHCQASGGGLWFADPPTFSVAVQQILDDQSLRASLATGGREYVLSTFSWPEVRKRFLGALERWA